MTGNADIPGQAFVPGFDQKIQCSAGSQGEFSLDNIGKVVHLQQIDPVYLKSIKRPLKLFPAELPKGRSRGTISVGRPTG